MAVLMCTERGDSHEWQPLTWYREDSVEADRMGDNF
jgi:hypothetical protein